MDLTASPAVSVLVVSYNSRDMTLEAIRSVRRETTAPFEVICIDNGSEDGSAKAIAREFPDVRLIRSENIGFAAANNEAARYAKGERLLLLNPDTVVIENGIDRLLEFADRTPGARIWGGRTLFSDGTLNPTSCWGRMTLWSLFCSAAGLTRLFPRSRLFNRENIGDWKRDSEREVDIVTGCFFLIDRSLWDRLDGFNPDFFLYGEEADLCLRARKAGARPRISPTATIIHHGGGSEASSADKLVKVMRGKVTVMNAHWNPVSRLIGAGLFRTMVAVRAAANLVVRAPHDPGGGQDYRPDIWRIAFRRRAEWLGGWKLSRRA